MPQNTDKIKVYLHCSHAQEETGYPLAYKDEIYKCQNARANDNNPLKPNCKYTGSGECELVIHLEDRPLPPSPLEKSAEQPAPPNNQLKLS